MGHSGQSALELAAKVVTAFGSKHQSSQILSSARRTKKGLVEDESDSYAECYPGALEHDDAIYDSDGEETGDKKSGKIHSTITSEKPKIPKSQNKQALERDLQKINAILAKKKGHQQDDNHGQKSRA